MLTTLPGSVVTNQAVTLIATVTSSTSAVSPSGAVIFYAGKTPIKSCGKGAFAASGQTAVVTCQASFVAPASPVQLTAVFKPAVGLNVAGSTSPVVSLVVGKGSTSTSLTASGSSVKVGGV